MSVPATVSAGPAPGPATALCGGAVLAGSVLTLPPQAQGNTVELGMGMGMGSGLGSGSEHAFVPAASEVQATALHGDAASGVSLGASNASQQVHQVIGVKRAAGSEYATGEVIAVSNDNCIGNATEGAPALRPPLSTFGTGSRPSTASTTSGLDGFGGGSTSAECSAQSVGVV